MISPYKAMWILVGFDLPVLTKTDMRKANLFRNELLKIGFTRLQLSFYTYYAASKEKSERIASMVESLVPDNGHITVFFITDRQFAMTKNFFGKKKTEIKEPEQGVLLF